MKQVLGALGKLGISWLCAVVCMALILVILKLYETKGVFGGHLKRMFQAFTTILILILGLVLADAFTSVAKAMKWWILARKPRSFRQMDLIMGIEKGTNVVKLALESRSSTRVWSFIWLLSFIVSLFPDLSAVLAILRNPQGVQALVAIISVTFTITDGTDWNSTFTTPGGVTVSNLSCYFHSDPGHSTPSCDPHEGTKQGIAHAFGELAQESRCKSYDKISEVLESRENVRYFCRRDAGRQEFTYRFSEYNPEDRQRAYPYFTNRTISVSSGQCYVYDQTHSEPAKDTNGLDGARNKFFTNGTYSGNITVPNQSAGLDATTYIYRGTDPPANETAWSCGPRCIWMWAFKEALSFPPADPREPPVPQFFQCPITVSAVANAPADDAADPRHVPDDVARTAAAAIALEGRSAWATGPNLWTQFRYYPYGSVWETHYRRPHEVGANMAEFALGSLATMDARNPRLTVPGTRPHLGSTLAVDWRFFVGLCVSMAGIHFLLLAAAGWATLRHAAQDASALAVARLLEPLVSASGPAGPLLGGKAGGKEISDALDDGLRRRVAYQVDRDSGARGFSLCNNRNDEP